MMTKIALDTSLVPESSPDDCLARAKAWGFDGLVFSDALARATDDGGPTALSNPAAFSASLVDAGLTPVAIHTGLSLDHAQRASLDGAMERIRRAAECARALSCERIEILAASRSTDPLERALARSVDALTSLLNTAALSGTKLLLDNGGTPLHSRDLWHLRDAVDSPAVRYAFRPFDALLQGDPPSISIKRLAGGLEIVYVSDMKQGSGQVTRPALLGDGDANVPLLLELLKGVAFDGWLCVTWPALAQLGPVEDVLPRATQFLREELARPAVVLAAYKGDKHATRFAAHKPGTGETTVAHS